MSVADLTPPDSGAFRLMNARVPVRLIAEPAPWMPTEGLACVSLTIEKGRITRLLPDAEAAGEEAALPALDLDGGMVWPTCADLHTHLDNTHTWQRAPNPSGSWQDALEAVERDRAAHWSHRDITARMDYALRCAWVHGTSAIRTHLDSLEQQRHLAWTAFAEIRERWKDRITLQGVSLVLPFRYIGEGGVELADLVARHEGLLGGVLVDDPDPNDAVERIFTLAVERDLDVDLHVDETGNPASNALDTVARAAIRHGWEGRVTVGHCCSLSTRPPEDAAATVRHVAEAGLAVVSLPMCNLYLQDRGRGAATPRWRGVTLVQELDAAGVPVAFASDDTRDAYYPFGDLDPVEVFTQSVRIAQLEMRADYWVRAVTATPAGIMKRDAGGMLREGGPADLILFDARDFWELGARPQAARRVLRAGRAVNARLPDFRELDGLAD